MPSRDGTGPIGAGPNTGRGAGPCAKNVGTVKDVSQGTKKGLGPCGDGTSNGGGGRAGGRRKGPNGITYYT